MDVVKLVERAAKITGRIVSAASDEDLLGRSPCKGWDGRAVLNHLVGGMTLFAGKHVDGAPQFPDLLGDEPAQAYDRATKQLLASLRRKGALEKSVELPTGPLPGRVVASIALLELCMHGWDIARATGREMSLPRDLGAALEQTAQMIVTDGVRKPPFFGSKKKAPDGASSIEKVAAYTGRNV